MRTFKNISLLILAVVLTKCNSADKTAVQKSQFVTATIFMQVDSLPAFKYAVEKTDTLGNIIEHINFSKNGGLVTYIEQYTFDSLNRTTLLVQTWFPIGRLPNTNQSHFSYDSSVHLSKRLSTIRLDTIIEYFEYNPNHKIKSSKTLASADSYWNGITKYIYDNRDSCIKTENYGLTGDIQNHDSIVYTASSKTVFEYNVAIGLSSKTESIYKNGKRVKIIDYRLNFMSSPKDFYVDKETDYEYDKGRLVKKTIKYSDHTEWCGVERSAKTETYKYTYD